MRIKLIVSDPPARAELASRAALIDPRGLRPGTEVTVVPTRAGPKGAGSAYDHALAEFAVLDAGVRAADGDIDAICLDAASDPAVDALRSRLDLPVVGAGGGALWLGRLLGLPLAYLVPDEEAAGVERTLAAVDARTAFVSRVASANGGVEADAEAVLRSGEAAVAAGAACIALVGSARQAEGRLAERLGVPVFDATLAAIKLAEVMVGLQLTHSRAAIVAPSRIQDELLGARLRSDPVSADPIVVAADDHASTRRIRVVVPHSDMDDDAVAKRADVIVPGLLRDTTRVDYTGLRSSSNLADSPYASLLMDVFCLEGGLRAQDEGFDALTVDSTSDSGIPALRSRLDILVVGTGQAVWASAAAVSTRFSILAMEPEWIHFYRKNLKVARLSGALASMRDVGTPTDPYNLFSGKEEEMFRTLTELGRAAIEDDGAEAIIIGSTTMHQAGDHLAAELPVPVLNPGRVALRSIEALLELGLMQSRVSAPRPGLPHDEVFA